MARYTIDFTTNANKIVREIEDVNRKIAEVARTGKSVKITLDAAPLRASLDATFRQLDNQIAQMQRKLANLPIGSRKFQQQATALGITEGTRQRGGMQANAIQLGAQAEAFDIGSVQRLQRQLQAARIEASQISPNTSEWVAFQRQIGQINGQLKTSERLAESIQMQESLGAFAPGSLNALEAKLTIIRNRAREISPNTSEWKALNQEILKTETAIKKQTKRPLTRGQRLGAAGGAFLYGGGLGGGVGSAVGGIAGGLAGGVPGAFTGAAIGQAVDNLTATTSAITEQSASLRRYQAGLASASTSLQDYVESVREVEKISNRLLIPIAEATKKFTQLKASTVALGFDTKTTADIFEGTTAAVLRSGGSLEDVDGAMRAVVQVFSKGKLTAEELRGQLAERLPGAVVDFANSAGMSVQELDAAFESGTTSIDDFVKFLRSKKNETSDYVDELATRSEFAGARLSKAFENLQLNIGASLQPAGAAFQDFITKSINGTNRLVSALIELGAIQPGPDFYRSQALAGANGGVAGLEEQLLAAGARETAARQGAESVGLGFIADFLPDVAEASKQVKILEEALTGIRKDAKLTKERVAQINKESQEKQGRQQFLNAIEAREQALANARENYENEIASIRENAIKQAEALERRYQDQRLQDERELGRVRRELAASVEEEGLLRRGIGGEDPALLEQERRLGEAVRQYTEDKISREQEAQDRQIGLARELEDFKRQNAEAINKAGERYAKAIGKIQQDYAKSVAKLIEDGSGNGAKKLAAAGKLIAAQIARASAQESFVAQTGGAIIPLGRGMYEASGAQYTEAALLEAAKGTSPATLTAAKAFVDATKDIEQAQKDLSQSMQLTAQSVKVQFTGISTADLESSIQKKQQALSDSLKGINEEKEALSEQVNIRNVLLKEFVQAAQANNANIKAIDDQNEAIEGQRQLIQSGVLPALAEAAIEREKSFAQERKLAQNAAANLSSQIKDKDIQKEITQELENQLKRISSQEEVYERLQQTLRDNAALLEAAKIEAQTKNVGAGLFAGFINEAGVAYEEQIAKGVSPEVAASVARVTEQFTLAKTAADALQGSINGIGDAIGQVLTEGVAGLISGTATAKEVFASFLQSVAQTLQQAAQQIIATYIAIGIAKIFAGFSGGSGSANSLDTSGFKQYPLLPTPSANGSYFDGPTAFFANGGIVSSPSFFQFADGGKINMGMMGEAGPEAIMPLKRGADGKLGVQVADNRAALNAASNAAAEGSSDAFGDENEMDAAGRAAIREIERIKENKNSLTSNSERSIMKQMLDSERDRISESRSEVNSQQLTSEISLMRERMLENRMQLESQRSAVERSYETERLRENRMELMSQQYESERRFERERIEKMASTSQKLDINYTSQVINNVEYVTREQAEQLAAQSALRGRELALGSLQNSVKARKRVGIA